jgi:hypothetical protein
MLRTRPDAHFRAELEERGHGPYLPNGTDDSDPRPAYMHEFSSAPSEPLRPVGPAETRSGRNPNSAALGVASLALARTRHRLPGALTSSINQRLDVLDLGFHPRVVLGAAATATSAYWCREPAQTRVIKVYSNTTPYIDTAIRATETSSWSAAVTSATWKNQRNSPAGYSNSSNRCPPLRALWIEGGDSGALGTDGSLPRTIERSCGANATDLHMLRRDECRRREPVGPSCPFEFAPRGM